jgi:hypothetical protein
MENNEQISNPSSAWSVENSKQQCMLHAFYTFANCNMNGIFYLNPKANL